MWSLQEVIDRVKESEKFKAVRELYRDVELEPGELQGMEALYVKILGRCVATVEIPRDSEPFSYLHWGSDYTVFPREVRKMYSIQSIYSGKMLEYPGYSRYCTYSLGEVTNAVLHVFQEIQADGIGIARYQYKKTSEIHEPTGMPVYRVLKGGVAVGVKVLGPCLDARGIKWLGSQNTRIGLGVYVPRVSAVMADVSVCWDDDMSDSRALHVLESTRKGVELGPYGDDVYGKVTINYGGSQAGSDYNPALGEWCTHSGSLVENVYTVVRGRIPKVKENTALRNLMVYTQAPTFPSGIQVTGGFGTTGGPVPTSHLVEREYGYDEWDIVRIPDYRDVQNDTRYITFGPVGSENGTLTAVLANDGVIYVTRGCFEGTLEDFREAVEETHKHEDSQFYREYLAIIEVIKARFPTGREHGRDSDK